MFNHNYIPVGIFVLIILLSSRHYVQWTIEHYWQCFSVTCLLVKNFFGAHSFPGCLCILEVCRLTNDFSEHRY